MAKSAGARSEKQEARREDREYQGDDHQRVASKDESHPVIKMSSERSSSTKLEGRLPVHMRDYPTPWQRKTMWAALTAFFVVLLIIIVGAVIWTGANIISFLQPILIPVAIAMILTYLLDPLVTKMSRGTLSRTKAVALLFAIAFFALGGLVAWLVPTISIQSANFAKEVPAYTEKARDRIVDLIYRFDQTFGLFGGVHGKSASTSLTNWLIGPASPSPHPQPTGTVPASPPAPQAFASPSETIAPSPSKLSTAERQRIQAYVEKQIPNIQRALPTLTEKFWGILKKSIGGFLGVTGFLLSLILVPIYLFFLLTEKPRIEERWKDYLPLRASPLKDEVAEALSEINKYITAYFRGQLLVCVVDGILIGTALTLIGLNFAPLIGVLVVILTMVPYIGIIVCWVPAVLIAAFQWGDWLHPIGVTLIFIVIQNLEGIFYAPRIVGNYVGLHPMTVIVSIFVWGLIIGGVLGPLLAVPLTATIKVLLARYVWGRRLREEVAESIEDLSVVEKSEAATQP
jgi:predicted PurR-regulated permease PerM